MKSSEILANTDRTSWSRIWMVLKYLWPSIKPMVIFYPLIAILIAVVMHNAVYNQQTWSLPLLSLLSYVVMFSPCFFSRQRNNEVFYSLPALGFEKVSAIFAVILIGVPILLLPTKIYGLFFVSDSLLMDTYSKTMGINVSAGSMLMGVVVLYTCEGAALWAVFKAKSHRALKACGAAIGMMFAYFTVSFLLGFFAAIFVGELVDTSKIYMAITCIACFTMVFVYYKAAKAISRKQI